MTYLFTEDYEKSAKYLQESIARNAFVIPPPTKLHLIKQIWEKLLPHRELEIGVGIVNVKLGTGSPSTYVGSEMSDGERVIFYLIGQCLSVPENSIIVLDEPEIHLHKSLQSALWDAVEAERPDCQFVYITHDIDFATTRTGATKICLRSYDGEQWDWFEVPESEAIPEDTLLQIIGSRKPILFVEGDKRSLDQFILRQLYPDYSIVPLAGCQRVINATASFNSLLELHHLHCYGIIDRDYRTEEKIRYLQKRNIYCLEVAEVENLYLLEGVLQVVATKMLREDFPNIMQQVRDKVLSQLENDKVKVASAITAFAMERALSFLDNKAKGASDLQSALDKLTNGIDVNSLYQRALDKIDLIIDNRDYDSAIKIYKNKGLISQISPLMGFQHPDMLNFIKKLLTTQDGQLALEAIRKAVPKLP